MTTAEGYGHAPPYDQSIIPDRAQIDIEEAIASTRSGRASCAPGMAIKRPVLRWHGGKWRLAPWIIEYLPRHRVYVEPFCGAASILLRKARSYAEVINDLDDDVVNLFRILRDPGTASALSKRLRLTPFARAEFEEAYVHSHDQVERAARLIVRSFMGFGSDGARIDIRTGFRANSNRAGTTPARDWSTVADGIESLTARLSGVVVERRDALACMAQHDGPDTLHYVDPPYLPEVRSISHRKHGYAHELDSSDHADLLRELSKLAGMVVLSGYPHPSYDAALPGWHRLTRAAMADGARPRVEALWLNPQASAALSCRDLFA